MREATGGFSQHCEDVFINELLKKENGYYVDVGAGDGIFLSNTYYFYLKGWQGICVDPDPVSFEKLKTNRPKDELLDSVICSEIGTVDLHLTSLYGLSSLKFDTRVKTCHTETVKVKSTTLNDIIPTDIEIDLLDIDVEASEMEVLAGIDLERIRPKLILIEYEQRGEEPYQSILPEISEVLSDYKLVRTFGELNALFIRMDGKTV